MPAGSMICRDVNRTWFSRGPSSRRSMVVTSLAFVSFMIWISLKTLPGFACTVSKHYIGLSVAFLCWLPPPRFDAERRAARQRLVLLTVRDTCSPPPIGWAWVVVAAVIWQCANFISVWYEFCAISGNSPVQDFFPGNGKFFGEWNIYSYYIITLFYSSHFVLASFQCFSTGVCCFQCTHYAAKIECSPLYVDIVKI